ncbi:winged helix-turn-helix transcriptional regulator [Candidatus Bathyarchaeota archaeon]|nr:winged helix-turn-helix transcriptional regulator [Candidatus Bathyarchaeota archaeon]
MKDVELRLISELMKNSRRSDRDLAKALDVSQPTVTRIRTKLEREGYIREYTMIPDFNRIGYEISSITFAKLKSGLPPKELEKTRKMAREMEKETAFESIVIAKGLGCNSDMVIVSFHENYGAYSQFIDMLKSFPNVDLTNLNSFVISLSQEHYRHLTFKTLSKHMLTLKKNKD